ncbi:MAG: hypothetical protein IJ817_01900 [Clostridia bacterium]|nr:hypothetical protein [Clostridia bacterium]
MSYEEAKVYFDGSHYIAIPHTERPKKKRLKPVEDIIEVVQEKEEGSETEMASEPFLSENIQENNDVKMTPLFEGKLHPEAKKCKKITKKAYFDELYMQFFGCSKKERRLMIIEKMQSYFNTRTDCERFVDLNLERKLRNLICRKVRMTRKANLANFNYFCTFTYDSKLHTEESFKKKLRTCFRHFCERKKWRYMGVWERAPETGRLHFHGLFHIPENSLSGELIEVRDFDKRSKQMRKTYQSTFFNKRFGRSDFEEIDPEEKLLGHAMAYLMKYIEKTGEKIVYSKGLPQYFISDILRDDVVITIGQEEKKLLLFDNFRCWDEGVFMGTVSPAVIEQMRKSN